jgi:nucleoside-diphosphate-sugar epimerase
MYRNSNWWVNVFIKWITRYHMSENNRVCIIGGTGFLGYHALVEFIDHGWETTVIGLPSSERSLNFPPEVKVILKDIETLTDYDLLALMRGHTALIYAAGMDDRSIPHKPAYPKFFHENVENPIRVLKLAREAGVKRAVIFGSYFVHFDRLWPEMKLAQHHPYIRSRVEQEKAVLSLAGMDVDVLELPYVFGSLPIDGWKPLWLPLIKYLYRSPIILFTPGGAACVSARTVAAAAYKTIVNGRAGNCYPINQENLTWEQLLNSLTRVRGLRKRVISLPKWIVEICMYSISILHYLQGKEGGLDPRYFTGLQTANTFVDPSPSQNRLGYEMKDLDEAFRDTVEACGFKKGD